MSKDWAWKPPSRVAGVRKVKPDRRYEPPVMESGSKRTLAPMKAEGVTEAKCSKCFRVFPKGKQVCPKCGGSTQQTSKPKNTGTQEIMTGRWGHGPGNNVCSTLLGRNGYEHQIVDNLDRHYGKRAREMRKALKQQRKKMRRAGLHVEARKTMPIHEPRGSKHLHIHEAEQDRDVALKPINLHGLYDLKAKGICKAV